LTWVGWCSSSSRKASGLTPTAVFALATPKSPIDRGGRWQIQLYLYCNLFFVFTFPSYSLTPTRAEFGIKPHSQSWSPGSDPGLGFDCRSKLRGYSKFLNWPALAHLKTTAQQVDARRHDFYTVGHMDLSGSITAWKTVGLCHRSRTCCHVVNKDANEHARLWKQLFIRLWALHTVSRYL
jgi:hypothetical protein